MIEKIEVFGQILEFDEALVRDTKLHIFTQNMAAQAAKEVEEFLKKTGLNIFTNNKLVRKSIKNIYDISNERIAEYCNKTMGGCILDAEDFTYPERCLDWVCEFDNVMLSYLEFKLSGDKERLGQSFVDFISKCKSAVFIDVYKSLDFIELLLQKEGVNLCIVTSNDEERAVSLFEQLKKTKDKNQAYKLAYEMFKADPTEREYYEYCMINYPEELLGLFSMYEVVGFEVKQDYVESMFKNYYKKMPHRTEPELLQIKNQFDAIQNIIGVFDTDIHKKVEKREQKEKIKQEKLEQQKKDLELKRDLQKRTVYGTVYDSLEDAEKAKAEHNKVDVLKEQLLTTKSQKKRYEIFSKFDMDINNADAKSRYDQLKEKVSTKEPVSEKINILYGITIVIAFILAAIFELTEVNEILFMIPMLWAAFGIWIWTIWKIIWFVKSKKKSYYKNIKYI